MIGDKKTQEQLSEEISKLRKRIVDLERSESKLVRVEEELKISESDDLKSLSKGFHHWHYRPNGSLNRNDFIDYLKNNDFSLWKEIKANQ